MSFNFAETDRRLQADEDGLHDDIGMRASFGERVVTTVAVTLALVFVATVALLMAAA